MQLTEDFTLQELLASATATRKNVTEQFTPSDAVVQNLKKLCVNVMQPISDKFGEVVVSSGYRCKRLNKMIGGAINSEHTEGKAADFIIRGLSVEEAFQKIINSDILYNQCIQEFSQWIHISFSATNKKQNLRAIKNSSGKTQYIKA